MFSGGMVYLLGAMGAMGAAVVLFYNLWRRGQAKQEQLERQLAGQKEQAKHGEKLQKTVDKTRREGEEREEEVVKQVRKGRRDHLDNSG